MSINADDHSRPSPEHPGAGEPVMGRPVTSGTGRDVAGESSRGVAFGRQSNNVAGLRADVTMLMELERAERQLAAKRIEVLARVDLRAMREAGFDAHLGVPANPRDTMAHRAARAEVAAALCLSEQTIDRQLVRADTLTTQYVATVQALGEGAISPVHATIILDAGDVIGRYGFDDTPEIAARRGVYERRVLTHAVKMTPNQLRPKARRIAEEYALTDLDTRHEVARLRRKVWVRPVEDGMAELCAYLPAHEALAIHSRLTRMAQGVQVAESRAARAARAAQERAAAEGDLAMPGDAPGAETGADLADGAAAGMLIVSQRRARDEIRADLLTDFLLHGTGDTATGGPETGISGIVQVVTHETHLLEHPERSEHHDGHEPAQDQAQGQSLVRSRGATARALRPPRPELEGYGPFPVNAARSIAGGRNGQIVPWDIVTASPLTGDVLRVDRYRPSEKMRRFLIARDLRCRFPGCRTPAHRCEVDHTIDAALGGETSTANLGNLCVGHHQLKHHSGWDVEQHDYGVYEWTSPAGLTHIEEPVSRVRFVEMVDPTLVWHHTRGRASEETERQPSTGAQGTAPPEAKTSRHRALLDDGALLDDTRTQPPEDLPETRF